MKKMISYLRTKKIFSVPLALLLSVLLIVSAVAGVYAATSADWFTQKTPVTGYAYSIVLVGDTQKTLVQDPDKFPSIYDWILDNKAAKNIQYVIGLGDITDRDSDAEWEVAYENITRLHGQVGYSLCIGNHDSSAQFNAYFNEEQYLSTVEGCFDGAVENTWRTLVVGDIQYLIMTLDYGPSDVVIDWANSVIADHPNHRVILSTHAYLYSDGTTQDNTDGWVPSAYNGRFNDGHEMWEKLVSKHENIELVVCGHIGSDQVVMTQATGDHGNVVTQLLVNPQDVDANLGSTGMITVLYFSEDGKNVTVETYSTIKKQYFKESNQYSFTLG